MHLKFEIMVAKMRGSSIYYRTTPHLPIESYSSDNLLATKKSNKGKKEIVVLPVYSKEKVGSETSQHLLWPWYTIQPIAELETDTPVLSQDITQQGDIEHRLEIDRKLLDKLTDGLPVVFFILNRQGKMMWWNKRLEVVTGYSKEELTHFPLRNLFPPSEREKIDRTVKKVLSEGNDKVESWLLTKNARRIPFHLKAHQIKVKEKPYIIGLGIEVAPAEESEQNRMLLQAITRQSETVIFIKDNEGKYFIVNPKFEEVLGLKNRQIIGKTDSDLFDETYAQVLRQDDLKVIEQKKPRKFEEQVNTPQGKRYYLTSKFPLYGVPGLEQGIYGIATDITRFKEKELRAQAQQEAITYLATDMAWSEETLDAKLNIISQTSADTLKVSRVNIWLLENDYLRCISSYDSGVMNRTKGEVLNIKDYPNYYNAIKASREIAIEDARNDHRSRELNENYLIPNDIYSLLDTSVHISRSLIVLVCHEAVGEKRKWKQDEITFVGAIADQVVQVLAKDERETREKEIRESLKEKEILLSEIHHRVKNNLAVVSSILQLQTFEEKNEEIRSKLLDSVVRIKTMATIHERMYQSQSFSKLEFSENIQKLVTNIIDLYQPTTQIKLDFQLQSMQLNINQAIPCSLIINEVVTNILKHAFTDRDKGIIIFSLSEDNNRISLIVKDNGVGLPENFDAAEPKTLGLVLIDVLAQQLEADYKFISDDEGCEFRLWFERAEGKKGIASAYIG